MRTPLVACLVLLAAACSDSTGPSALPSALIGHWVASPQCSPVCGFTLTSVSNPGVSVDLVAPPANVTVELDFQSSGAASLRIFGQTIPGTARVDGSTLYLSSGGSTDTIDYTVTGTTLDLKFRSALADLADFNGDGIMDAGYARAVLRKQ
jgi:hypothetical protein